MLSITKKIQFCYGHQLEEYPGDCANIHGHNSCLEVEIGLKQKDFIKLQRNQHFARAGENPQDHKTYVGLILDFKILKAKIKEVVCEIDHKFVNHIPAFHKTPTTIENICLWFVDELICVLHEFDVDLLRVRVSETDDSWAEWKKD